MPSTVPYHPDHLLSLGIDPSVLLLDTDYEPAMTLLDDNGTVIACGGFRCIPGGVAEAWAVAGPLAEKYPLAFCKETRRLMRRWMKEYGIRRLTASVDYADKRACRWAHWLGFDRVLGEYFRYDDEVLLLVVIKE